MSDLAAVGLFLACLAATLGLIRVCDWLRPHQPARPDTDAAQHTETRQ